MSRVLRKSNRFRSAMESGALIVHENFDKSAARVVAIRASAEPLIPNAFTWLNAHGFAVSHQTSKFSSSSELEIAKPRARASSRSSKARASV